MPSPAPENGPGIAARNQPDARPATVADDLREAICESRLSSRVLGTLCGVDASVICRFQSDKGYRVSLDVAERIAAGLGLRLTAAARRPPPRRPGRPRKPAMGLAWDVLRLVGPDHRVVIRGSRTAITLSGNDSLLIRSMIELRDAGIRRSTPQELRDASGVQDPVRTLRLLKGKHPALASSLAFPGVKGGKGDSGYGLADS